MICTIFRWIIFNTKIRVCNCCDIHTTYICYCLYLNVYVAQILLICFETKLFFFSFQSSFTDIAKVLSEFFRDLDIVPSDVIVGLVLLRKRQQLLRLRTIHQVSSHNSKKFPNLNFPPNQKLPFSKNHSFSGSHHPDEQKRGIWG